MLNYTLGPPQEGMYSLSYSELRGDYWRFRRMTNEEFLGSVVEALHFACVVCWLKETGSGVLADNGIIHELIHLLDPKTRPLMNVAHIRMDFNEVLELA